MKFIHQYFLSKFRLPFLSRLSHLHLASGLPVRQPEPDLSDGLNHQFRKFLPLNSCEEACIDVDLQVIHLLGFRSREIL